MQEAYIFSISEKCIPEHKLVDSSFICFIVSFSILTISCILSQKLCMSGFKGYIFKYVIQSRISGKIDGLRRLGRKAVSFPENEVYFD